MRSLVLIPSRRLDCLEFLVLSMSPARLHWLCRCISHCFLPTKFLLWVEKLRQGVLTLPDQSFVTYVLDGLQNGFCVGFNPASVSLKSATHNMPSAIFQPLVIDDLTFQTLHRILSFQALEFAPYPFKDSIRTLNLSNIGIGILSFFKHWNLHLILSNIRIRTLPSQRLDSHLKPFEHWNSRLILSKTGFTP